MDNTIIPSENCTERCASKYLNKAKPLAENDWNRPSYHFCPMSQWMNDPNGGIYHAGWYHMFYLQDPFAADGFS